MNAVAMEFVTRIDELLYEVMIPKAYKKELEDIDFIVPCKQTNQVDKRRNEMWKGYKRSFIYIGLTLTWIYVYTEYIQSVFPSSPSDVAQHCEYLWDSSRRACSGFSGRIANMFAPGSGDDNCFPYGIPAHSD